MFWKRKVRAPADSIAEDLFKECVQTPIPGTQELFSNQADAWAAINAQMRLYQFASVLLAVLDAERRDPAFGPVREILEQRFFPSSFSEGRVQLEEVRNAMRDLVTLIQPSDEPQPMSWARDWLKRIGVHDSNPATLSLFALRWPHHYVAVAKSLREFTPVS